LQPAAFFASSLQRKVEPASLERKRNLATPLARALPGPLTILVCGGSVSALGGGGSGPGGGEYPESTATPQGWPPPVAMKLWSTPVPSVFARPIALVPELAQ
jgi:hypothetical protein